MKTFGLLPSSPAIKDMNDAQWIYCYLNMIEDQEEEEDLWKARLKYMGLFISPKMVEELTKLEAKEKGRKYTSNNYSSNDSNNDSNNAVYNNSEFEDELSKTLAGEQFMELPDMDEEVGNPNLSSDEFINFLENNIDQFSDLQQKIDLNKQIKEQESNYDLDIIEID